MEIQKSKLERMYREMTNKEICKKLGITNPTLVSYLKKLDIPLKGRGNNRRTTKVKLVSE